MLTLYITCLVFGGVLLVISMFSGGDAEVEAGHDLGGGADFDHGLDAGGHDLQLEAGGDMELSVADDMDLSAVDAGADADLAVIDAGHDLPVDAQDGLHHGDGHGALSGALQFFSFRNMVYLTTFFGLTGTVLTLTGTGFGLTLLASGGLGLFAAGVGHKFMRYLRESESGQATDTATLVGRTARVTLPVGKEHKGKIMLTTGDQQLQLLAVVDVSSESSELPVGTPVVLLRVERGIAFVDRADFMETQ